MSGRRIDDFTRVETPSDNTQSGNDDAQCVKVTVDSGDPEVFSFEQEVCEAKGPAACAP